MLWVLLVFIKIRWIFSVKDTLGFFIINFIPPRNLYQIILGISINHKAHEESGVSQWHHWDVLAGSPGDGISTPAANPTFLGNSQTPGTSGRLIIDISGAGLSLRNSARCWEIFSNCIFLFNKPKFPLSEVLSQHFPGAFFGWVQRLFSDGNQ